MRDTKSIRYFATEQAIPEHQQPSRLDKSPAPSFARSSDRDDAQEYMLHLRHNINGKKLPEKSLRAKMKIRTQSKIEKLNATFTTQERYDAFDHFLRSRKPIGTAQAILEFHSGQVIDVNVRHDIAGEKSGSRLKRAESSAMVEESRWLQTAVESDQEDYVCLLCAHHPAQANLDEALKIAARLNFIAIATELLRSGANPNTCHKEFRKRSSNGDLIWTAMLLGSRLHEIDQEEKDKALLAAVNNNNFDMAHLLLSVKADAASSSGAPLASAVRTVNFRMLTLLISEPARIEKASLRAAIESACDYSSLRISNRVQFINILLSAGAEVPSVLRKDLLKKAVSGNDVALVSLLVKHKQLSGSEATAALEYVVKVPSETDVVRISRSLLVAGATVADMGEVLHWAVQKDYRTMVALLVGQGVSIDFKEAVVVQLALERQDIQLLKLLLLGDSDASKTSVSSGTTLASVLPQALSLSTQKMRHEAIELLVRKGLDGDHLHRALLSVITNPAICNADLALKLLRGGASVNFRENQENCIISAAKDGNLLLLELLIAREWKAKPQILSDTVLTLCIFRARSPFAHLKRSMTTILQGGAVCNGRQVAQAFLILAQAAEDVECAELAELLLQHGADVNYQDGQIIKHALILSNENLMIAICRSERINKNSFVHVIQLAIDGARTDQTRLSLLTYACRKFKSEMSDALVSEISSGPSGGQDEIIDILLSNGAQVNYKNGVVFEHIINGSSESRSIVHLSWLLRKEPGERALRTAFGSARRFQCTLDHRYRLFELILKAGHRGDDVNETLNDVIVSNQADLSMPALLLEHGADINAAVGVALSSATRNANLELLSKMITYKLTVETVDRAFRVACATEVSKACKFRLFACLLSTGKVSKDCVTYALTLSITRGNLEEHLLSLLCEHGALIETEALVYLVDREDIVAARFLLGLQTPNKKCRSQAVKASLGLEKSIRLDFAKLLVIHGLSRAEWTEALHTSIKDHDLELLKLLLHHGSNREHEVERAVVIAATTLNPDLMRALLAGAPSSRARNEAFESLLDPEIIHSTSGFMAVALLLLESGVDQALRDRALIQTLEAFPQHQSDFFQILIQHGADVNAKACTTFVTAGQFENLDVFKLLLHSRANFDQVIKALISRFPVDRYVRLLQLVFIVLRCELYQSNSLDSSVILQAMHRFKHGENLIRLLLDHGYPPGESTRSGDHDNARAEFVTPLIWALGQPGPGVSDKVILELLGKEKEAPPQLSANPHFSTPDSGTTAVHMAAQNGRCAVLERLIELRVNLSAVDSSGKSPLFYATANEDTETVFMLLENGAHSNDGSLQEAASLCNKGIVALLLEKDHDPDYSCDLHGGRTALGELCSQTNLEDGQQISTAYETMKLLIDAATDLSFKVKGKTVLHLALDNEHPIEVTRALLRFPEIYKDIRTDSEVFLYKDSQNRFLSPDVYVEQYCRLDNRVKSVLVDLLHQKGCKSKWFSKRGAQLPDCKGLPLALKEAMDRQDLADQAEQRENQRRHRTAQVELQIKEEHYRTDMVQNKERADLELFNAQRQNDQQVAHESRVAIQRRSNLNAERTDERNHIQERERLMYEAAQRTSQLHYTSQSNLKQLEYSSQRQLKELEYTSQDRVNQLQYAAADRQAQLERKLIESREAADSRSQAKAMERFARQDQSVRLAAKEQRLLMAEAQKARAVTDQRMAIQWEQPD